MHQKDTVARETFKQEGPEKVIGGKDVEGFWRREKKEELMEQYREPFITVTVKAQRRQWLGHVARIETEKRQNNY